MKKLLVIFVIMSAVITLFAQSPGKLSYQAVIRNTQDKLVTSHAIGMRVTILKGSVSGTAVYHETHRANTNANGLLTLEIGSGISSEDFSAIDWSKGPYFIMTETDPEGGTNYTITGISQLLSVPYALYAQTAGSLAGPVNETDPVFKASQAARITSGDITKLGNLSGINTGDQDISAMTHANRTSLDAVRGINTGDQDLSGLATTTSVTSGLSVKVDKVAGKGLSTEDYSAAEKSKVSNLSGVNTGDQDISAMTHTNRTALDAVTGTNTGDQDLSGLATTSSVTTGLSTKVDKVVGKGLSTEDYTTAEKTKVANLSGVNTGDQDISAMTHTNRTALDAVSGINTGDQDLSGLATTSAVTTGLATKVDKVAGKGLSTEDYTTPEKTKLAAITGTNTGDQDLSGLATSTALTTGLNLKVDKVAGKGLSTEDYTTPEKSKLAAITGTNTGDQDLSGLATKIEVTSGLDTKVTKVAGKGLSTEDYTTPEKAKLAAITGTNTGDQDLSGLATTSSVTTGLSTKVDKVVGKGLSTEDFTTAEKTKVSNLSGVNTGDQDISAMTHANRTALDAVTGINTGDQDLSGLATKTEVTTGLATKVDKVAGKGLSTEDYSTAEKTKVSNLSGVNTGDQDISAMTHTNRTALDAVTGINTGDQDLSGLATTTSVTTGLATKVDKVAGKGLSTEDYTTAEKTKVANLSGVNTGDQDISAMTHTNRTALDAVSGINTGDQDLSGLATKTEVTTGLATKVDKVAGQGLSTEDYTTPEKTKLAAITGTNTGDQDLSGLATTTSVTTGLAAKVDKVAGKGLSTEDYTTAEKTKVSNLSGVNTGDQDISAMTHTNRTALDAVTGTNTGDQDLSGLATSTALTTGLNAKVDKVAGKGLSTEDYTTPEKTKLAAITGTNTGDQDISAMTHTNRTALDAVTGINTGDQDLSGLATSTALTTGLNAKVDKVAGKGLSTEDYTTPEKTKLAAITGTNTGDQDISAMTHTNRTALDAVTGINTGDQDLSGLATKTEVTTGLAFKVDKVAGKGLSTEDYTTAEKTKVSNLSGVNTGDQDISAMTHTNRTALDAVTGINTGDQDLSGLATTTSVTTGLATKVDKVAGKGLSTEDYTSAEKSKVSNLSGVNTGDQDISAMTHTNRTALDAVSGINTGDQDLSGLATKIEVTSGLDTKVTKVAGKGLSTEDYTTPEKTKLAAITGTNTGDQDLSGLATTTSVTTGLATKVDKVAGKGLSTEDYTSAEKSKVSNLSGVNTGDQDISAMTHANRTALDAVTGINTGDQDLSGLATTTSVTTGLATKVDKVAGKGLSTEDYSTAEKTKVSNLSGVNTGDQDISAMTHTNRTALDAVSGINTGDQDLNGLATKTEVTTGLATKVDKVAGKGLSTEDYTTPEKTKLAAITGTNTGDQDLSGLATTTSVTTGLAAKVDKVAGKGLSTEDYTTPEKAKLAAITGTNTGDQDLSGLATTTSVSTSLATKVDKVAGKGLSTEDYTTAEKTKVSNLSGVNTGDQDISSMTHTNRTALDAVSGINTGDQDLSGLATTTSVTTGLATKVDKVAGKGLSTEDYTAAEKSKVSNLSGVNTGDQDIAAMTHTNRIALDAVSGINTGDQDLSGLATKIEVTSGLDTKVTKVAGKGLSTEDYTTPEKTKLAAITGTNTGDQDLSGLATTTSVTTGLATKVDKVAGKGLSTEDYTSAEKSKVSNLSGVNTGDQDISAMTHANRTALDAVTGTNTGDQDLSGLATTTSVTTGLATKVDKVAGKGLSTEDYTSAEKSKVSNLSGVNTGDQDISAMTHANRTALDAVTGTNTGDQDLSGLATTTSVTTGLATKVDKITGKGLSTEDYTTAEKAKVSNLSGVNTGDQDISAMTHTNRTALDAVSGINTGDQDLSGLATTTAVTTGLAAKVDKVAGKGLSTEDYTSAEKSKVSNLSGVNTGDQDISAMIHANRTALDAVTGTNTGDQDLIGLATTTALTTGLNTKVDKLAGKGLSSNDYTTDEQTKLTGIAAGAEVNVQADWNQTTTTADDFIKNKPAIPASYTHPTGDGNLHVPATEETSNGKVLTAGATAASLIWSTPYSGLTNFTESNFTYDSRTGVTFTPNNVETNVYLVLQPKGNGGILAQQPDGTYAGGNRRGVRALDLQMSRSDAAMVASASDATIVGGINNTASGTGSIVVGGIQNTASGKFSTAMGYGTNAPSFCETVLGKYNTDYTPSSAYYPVATDRLFVIGNGNGPSEKQSNALTILKNANTTIGGLLTINGNGTNTSYLFPETRGTGGQVLQTDGSGGTSWSTPYTGLTNFTESNFTYDYRTGVRFTPNNAADIVDIVLQPKGYGAILAQQPDGTAAGGNIRGLQAVDLQTARENASQVASGDNSTILGGGGNSSQSFGSVVIGGVYNIASGMHSLATGYSCDATANYSIAIGKNATASNEYAVSIGNNPIASGYASLAMGDFTTASGRISTAMGNRTTAPSGYETVIGRYNSDYTPSSATDWIATDRLFVVGNGATDVTKSNALTILKNANTTIGGSLTINGNGTSTSYLFPAARGTNGQVLQTDGSGGTSWATPSSSGLTNFTESNYSYSSKTGVKLLATNADANVDIVLQPKGTGGIVAQQPDGTATGGNIRGSNAVDLQMARSSATQVASGTLSFAVGGSNTASGGSSFAVGGHNTASGGSSYAIGSNNTASEQHSIAIGDQNNSSGESSFAVGGHNGASGASSFAVGSINTASGSNSTAIGFANTSGGQYATAVGANNTSSGDRSFASGYLNTAQSFGETVLGYFATIGTGNTSNFVSTDRLFVIGNGDPNSTIRSDALSILKNANATIGGSLTINGNGTGTSLTLPATRGTNGNVLTTDGIGGTSWSTAGTASQWTTNGSNIYYNTGYVGIGITTPYAPLQFDNTLVNRKLVLWSTLNNDHQYYGFGVNASALRYQVQSTADNHVFYAGTSTTTSTELFRIKGTGQIVIPALTIKGVLLNNALGEVSSTIGTNGQVLTTNSSGGVSWTTPAVGTVTGVTGTAPIVSSGGNAPAISISAASASAAGSMSAADKVKLDGSTHAIGDSYGGGIVFYVYDGGRHGLIAATSDQSNNIRWYGGTNTNTRARADGIGAGLKNTAIIIANQGPVDGNAFAATVCNEYSVTVDGVTYGDWYLPSKYELNLLYLQKTVVGGFANNYYWSSSEYDSGYAWSQNFNLGNQATIVKSNPLYVRAVRAF